MKKTCIVLSSILFFLFAIFCFKFCSSINKTFAFETKRENIKYRFECESQKFEFNSNDFSCDEKLTNQRLKFISDKNKKEGYLKLKNLGLTKKEAILYLYPEITLIIEKLKKALNVTPISNNIKVIQNSCEIKFENGKKGCYINELKIYDDFEKQLLKNPTEYDFSIKLSEFENNNFKETEFKEKSCFSTSFASSGSARKHNIKTALSVFDGIILEDGEILSFNSTTGIRNQESGYASAKIISGGTFIDGFGGGVCQVSTTLYNACLLAGLEIIEVNSHSLPVSYIEPGFDAMVNIGSSDFIFRNNSGGRIIITTSSKNDICKVKIFGKSNKYKITRFSEKIKIIPAGQDEIVTDLSKFSNIDLKNGESKRISYAKDGYYSNAYLNFYDEKGNLLKTKKIRTNKYNPTKGVIIKREN